jgi:hypothetical protein
MTPPLSRNLASWNRKLENENWSFSDFDFRNWRDKPAATYFGLTFRRPVSVMER